MSDRIKGFVVTLDKDYRDDDVESVLDAIRMIRGVIGVDPVKAKMDDAIIEQRVRHELRMKLYAALD